MRAILNNDMIVSLTLQAGAGTEIGGLIPGVGFERMRFDGTAVVDLAALSQIWVKKISGGAFELHAVAVAGSQLVSMTYADRKNLIDDPAGTIRVKTAPEIADEDRAQAVAQLKGRLKARLKVKVGTMEDQMMNTLAFVSALIVYSRTQNPVLGQFFDDIIPTIKDIYPLARVEQILRAAGAELKAAMTDYYNDLDNLP